MVFKRNITITLACIITESLLSLIPIIPLIYIFFVTDEINELFSSLLIVPYLILIINVFLFLISLIAQLFLETKYYINKSSLVIKEREKIKVINYTEVANMTYDFGDITRFNTRPSQLVLFDNEFRQLLSINNPPVVMIHLLKKRCRNVKMSYYHNKRFLYLLALINGTVLTIIILTKIFY